ncbi:MAG: MCE-family protein Mce6D [Solirubrobacterales bacterium]|nr:MCE-family protein Mce6D [Solirubrobacterales bacterium]
MSPYDHDDEPEIDVRDFVGARDNRARLALEARRGARPMVTVVIGAIVGLAIAGYILANVSKTLLSKTREVSFVVADATGVVTGADEVRVKGIPAGAITKVEIKDGVAILTAKVQKKYGAIYKDAHAQLRPNTALQDMYLNIVDRGTKDAGELDSSEPLPAGQTEVPVSINDVLNVFKAPVRLRLHTLLDDLGGGLQDRGARLRTAFAEFVPFVQDAAALSDQLARRAPMVKRLIHNTAVLTDTISAHQQQLNTLVHSGALTLTTLKDSRGDLGATLDALPPTLRAIDSSFTAVRGTLPVVDTALRAVRPVAQQLPGALDDVQRLNASAAPAVNRLRTPVRALVPLSAALRPVSHDVAAAVDALKPQVPVVNKVTRDLVLCEKGIVGFFQWNMSLGKYGDSRGPYPRGNLVIGAQSSSVLNDPSEFYGSSCAPGRPIAGRPAKPSDGH